MPHATAYPFAPELLGIIPSLHSRARGLCRNHSDAQDLVQETLTRALSHAQQFEPGTNLRAWLQRILFHLYVSKYRREQREKSYSSQWAALGADPTISDRSEPGTECLSPRLAQAFKALPRKIAEVVERVDVDELSYREVSEVMQIPIGTVMSRLWRGRRRLAEAVADETLRPRAEAA